MLEAILFSPLILVAITALIIRFGTSRKRFGVHGWLWVALCTVTAFLLPYFYLGAWLPDLLSAPRRTLASEALPSGHTFRVIQYWNRLDFYSTELHVSSPGAPSKVFVLDPDDFKSWGVPLLIDENARVATITLSGDRKKTVKW
ncbi:hypothetical protein ACXR0O_09585 [Verrucomicrobiota bacterium sgz303538]